MAETASPPLASFFTALSLPLRNCARLRKIRVQMLILIIVHLFVLAKIATWRTSSIIVSINNQLHSRLRNAIIPCSN